MNMDINAARKNFSSLYDNEILIYWSTRYPVNLKWNFDNMILNNMTRDERIRVSDVNLECPLLPSSECIDSPFAFYALPQLKQIVFPILSIKFLDDLSIASAYLEVNGYSQETIFDYIALLKYSSPVRCPGGVFPQPLPALRIPDDALESKSVDDLSQKILKSCIVWILAHELGHIRYNHTGYDEITREEAQANEIEADTFATEIFRRAGVIPLGTTLLFMLLAHFSAHSGDYADENEWKMSVAESTHPLSYERLRSMAELYRKSPDDFVAIQPLPNPEVVLHIADEIEKIARLSEDSSMQKFIRLRGLAASPESLSPRTLDDPFSPLRKELRKAPADRPFDGFFEGTHSRFLLDGSTESLNAAMLFNSCGNKVNGRFSFGLGEGTFKGVISGESVTYEWEFGDLKGRGNLKSNSSGNINGVWGYEDHYEGGGIWYLERATGI